MAIGDTVYEEAWKIWSIESAKIYKTFQYILWKDAPDSLREPFIKAMKPIIEAASREDLLAIADRLDQTVAKMTGMLATIQQQTVMLRLYDIDEGRHETVAYLSVPLTHLEYLEKCLEGRDLGIENLGSDVPQLHTPEEIDKWAKGL
jgi:hypothetical protein